MSSAVHGLNGDYNSVSEALNAGETTITVVASYTERGQWSFGNSYFAITILPTVTIFYDNSLPMMISQDVPYDIIIKGGAIICLAQYLLLMGDISSSNIEFNNCNITTTYPSSLVSASSITFNSCTINANVLKLADLIYSDVTCNLCVMTGTILFSEQLTFITLNGCTVNGTLRLYANYQDLPLNATTFIPSIFYIVDTYITVLLLSSLYTTGTSFFAGMFLSNSWIENLLSSNDVPMYITSCNINNNTVIYNDLSGVESNNYVGLYNSTFSNNIIFDDLTFGNCIHSIIRGNDFENLTIGNDDEQGSLTSSILENNVLKQLVIMPGNNKNTGILNNTSANNSSFINNAYFTTSVITANNFGMLVSNQWFRDTTINRNNIPVIIFNEVLWNTVLTNMSSIDITFNAKICNLEVKALTNARLTFNDKVRYSKFHHNNTTNMTYRAKLIKSTIENNIGPSIIELNDKVIRSQLNHNIDVSFKVNKKLYHSIMVFNIIPNEQCIRSKDSILKYNLVK